MNFSENLQILRKGRNISQEKLAEELNVSRQTVGKWENGVSCPEAECLIEISDFFGVSIDTLLKGTVPVSPLFPQRTGSKLGGRFLHGFMCCHRNRAAPLQSFDKRSGRIRPPDFFRR